MPLDELMAILESDRQWTGELKHITRSGQQVIVESRQQLIETNGQKLILETNHDITDRKLAEQRLRESEERLRLGMQVAGFALAKVDYTSNTVELSPEAAALYGFETQIGGRGAEGQRGRGAEGQENPVGAGFAVNSSAVNTDLSAKPAPTNSKLSQSPLIVSREQIHATFHPEDCAELAQAIEQAIDPAGAGWFAQDHRVVWSNGEVRWLTVRKQIFFDRSSEVPKPTHAILVALDISDRKKTEAALRQNEDRLRMAIASAQLGTWDWNIITGELKWDTGSKAMFGTSPEAETSMEVFLAGIHPDDRDRLQAIIQASLNPASGGLFDAEYRTIGIQDRVERWLKSKGVLTAPQFLSKIL